MTRRHSATYILCIIVAIVAAQSVALGWSNPGTRTPGYWANHPEAWPVDSLTIGGVTYTKEQAILLIQLPVAGDKTLSLFPAVVAALLNTLIDNEILCIFDALVEANEWLVQYPPLSGVAASSEAWQDIADVFSTLDDYNNGLLCAPPAVD